MNHTPEIRKFITAIRHQLEGAQKPMVITISGPSGSGKSTIVRTLQAIFPDSLLIATDDYYIGKARMKTEMPAGQELNFDHPDAIDIPRLARDIRQLKAGHIVSAPLYNMRISEPYAETIELSPRPLVIVEGLVANYPSQRNLSDLSVCVTASFETRLARRIERDTTRKGHSPKETTRYMRDVVEPAYLAHFATWDRATSLMVRTDT